MINRKQKDILLTISIPVFIALVVRFIFDVSGFLEIMSSTFLISLPIIVGFVTIWLWNHDNQKSKIFQVCYSWIPILAFFVITLLLSIEGWACWIMMLPVFLVLSSVGGLLAGYFKNRDHKNTYLTLVLLLPFIIGPIENVIPRPKNAYTVFTSIEIVGSKEEIWKNVTRVREISRQEDDSRFSRWLGFPRPIQAELDFEGVGAHRQAIFDKGLVFDENVTEYEHQKMMKFTIVADPYNIPSTTMDEHIVIGGDYFNVLNGSYRLVSISENKYRLELDSEFILNTTFNYYASFWADQIMRDIQVNILNVIKERVEEND